MILFIDSVDIFLKSVINFNCISIRLSRATIASIESSSRECSCPWWLCVDIVDQRINHSISSPVVRVFTHGDWFSRKNLRWFIVAEIFLYPAVCINTHSPRANLDSLLAAVYAFINRRVTAIRAGMRASTSGIKALMDNKRVKKYFDTVIADLPTVKTTSRRETRKFISAPKARPPWKEKALKAAHRERRSVLIAVAGKSETRVTPENCLSGQRSA